MAVFKLARLGQIYDVLCDTEDLPILEQGSYNLLKQGISKLRVYDRINKNYFHRKIMNAPKGYSVDHIDGNPLNNQKSNLRVCLLKDNTKNSRKKGKNPTSIYKGVYFDKRKEPLKKRWVAQIKIDYKVKRLGRFLTEIEAAKAYNKAAQFHWGEYANLNEIKQ